MRGHYWDCCNSFSNIQLNLNIHDLFVHFAVFATQWTNTQPAISCSKLTIETLDQGVKYVES